MYQQQQLHQAIQQGAPSHLVYQGQQQQHFSESSAYTESSVPANSPSLPCHYQNYQVSLVALLCRQNTAPAVLTFSLLASRG